ncbi:SDR family oxidoreductase [Sphingobium yanoikuyae]|jgi:NAD(P)-dependent dehydrogenase (short-subunit alcohol dehydrogenase family)|uniref:SDR family NAD(P)-dependent oxidoreductase n=1 Tax=Sphingobium yanoikuyae TaxID=13690 RepID=A0A430BMC5_SPHYA|nr:SDR family oxidoreductase [Sphingobium yanoikuyae]RSU53863.1 SDR family NAD(P)-dependent oxidoreductase [Sphingobium yanoikuyae]
MQIAGRTIFITGGGGGIGGGMAQAFAEQGGRIILADIDAGFAEAEAAKLPAGTDAMALPIDVTRRDSWAQARAVAEARFGPVDILCNNAGIASGFAPLIDMDPADFDRLVAVNLTGVYNGIACFARAMVDRGVGHIVNTSSMNGLNPFGLFAAYSASKFGVLGLSDSLRQELAPHGVGVSTLFPGLTRSRMSESDTVGPGAMDPARLAQIRANMMEPIWLGRAVVRAVEQDQPYIITHPEYRDDLARRFDTILAAFGEPAQPGYRTGASATGR